MNRVTIDDALAKELLDAGLRTEVRDTTGHILGYFYCIAPQAMTPELLQWAKEQISDEEIEQALQEPGGCTTEELIHRLQQL